MPDSWTSTSEPGDVDDLVERLHRLRPLVEQHRASFDTARRLAEPVFDALCDIGAFRLFLPRALGGPELSPHGFMRVVEAATELDASVGWLVGNGGGMSRIGGYLAPEVAAPLFADRRAFVTSATGAVGEAVPVDGGYRVSGRWPFGSGVHHATWTMGLCAVASPEPAAAPELICCYVPRSAISIIDNWFVSGLRGTGSCDFEARDLFVPASHAHSFMGSVPTQAGILYRMPALSIFPLTVAVVPLGVARAAISGFSAVAATKARGGSSLREREMVQAEVGRLESLHRAARAFLVESITELMTAIDAGGERLVRARALFKAACTHAADSATRIVDSLCAMAGTAAILESGPLERCARDIHAAVKHIAMSPNNYVIAGRVLLGLDVSTARF